MDLFSVPDNGNPANYEAIQLIMAYHPDCLFVDLRHMTAAPSVDRRLRRGALVRQFGDLRYHHMATLLGVGTSAERQARGIASLVEYLAEGHDLLLFFPASSGAEDHYQQIMRTKLDAVCHAHGSSAAIPQECGQVVT